VTIDKELGSVNSNLSLVRHLLCVDSFARSQSRCYSIFERFVIAPFILLALLFPNPAAGAAESFIKFKTNSSMFGKSTFLIAPKNVAILNLSGSSIWNSSLPAQVQMIHPEAGCYFNNNVKAFISTQRGGLETFLTTKVIKVGDEKIAGQNCVHYVGFTSNETSKVPALEFWAIPKPACEKATCDFFCKLFAVPSQYGLPIKVRQMNAGVLGLTLVPIKFEIVTASTKAFTVPSGYRRAKDLASFYFAENSDTVQAAEINKYFSNDR